MARTGGVHIHMIGRKVSHYHILEKIGQGGMGEVYRAHDEHLERDVAIKVLPEGALTDEAARKRFRQEALALSKLNHPNIATVHDFDTQDGTDFLVIEYIPGVTLDEKLAGRALPEKEIRRLGEQMAEGLAAAHEHGVVHRDLKPGNLRITPDGRLKILDFGLAKLLRPQAAPEATASLVESSEVIGTAPYMAPEQLMGEAVDARTDIWSVGVVLYEMTTGKRPFTARLATRLADDILHQTQKLPSTVNESISPGLENIILKCLEKDPENRYQTVREIAVDLRRLSSPVTAPVVRPARRRRYAMPAAVIAFALLALVVLFGLNPGGLRERLLGGAAPGSGRVMMAVLPFGNLSGDPEQEYFSDGLTDEMTAQLGRMQPARLGVIASTSAMRYKGTQKPVQQIGRELGVDYLLEGSVRRDHGRVRITAQLIQVSDQTQLWAQTYERELVDVFAIQNDVAGSIARSLKMELLPAEQGRLFQAGPVNQEAHEAYLKGRYFWNKRTREGLQKALEYFRQAVEIAPDYALGYAGLADSYYVAGAQGMLPSAEAYHEAESAARKALELDDRLAEAHASLAAVTASRYDWSAAESEYRRAIELNPNYATAHHWYSLFLAAMGRHEEAVAEIQRAHELDPLSLIINHAVGWPYHLARRYDKAIQQYRKTLEMDPSFLPTYYDLGRAYLHYGMVEEAIAIGQELVARSGGQPDAKAALAYTYAAAGRKEAARKILNELKTTPQEGYVSPFDMARIYAGLGEKDQAFQWLERAYQDRSEYLMYLKVDPDLDPLRSDPRFQTLLRRMDFPP